MTAPPTPHEQPFIPPYPAEEEPGSPDLRREVRRGVVVTAVLTVCGTGLGFLWAWLAPRVVLVSDGTAVYLENSEGEQAFGSDGVFVLLALAVGAVTAAAVFWRLRDGGVGAVLGLALGGALGSLVAWRLGLWLGPTSDLVAHAKAVGKGMPFDAPLEMRAYGSLLVWSIASTAVYALLVWAFGPRDEEPGVLHWDTPQGPPPPA